MNTKNLLYKAAAGIFVLSAAWFLSAGSNGPAKRSSSTTAAKGEQKIFRVLNSVEIKQMLGKSKQKKIVLNIYPVKYSNDSLKNDLDLQVFFQDAVTGLNLGNGINPKKFALYTAWYMNFLKQHGIPQEKVPHGYFIEINPGTLEHKAGMNICVFTMQNEMQYCMIAGETGGNDMKQLENYGTGQEDCCSTQWTLRDSIGKCPPDCPKVSMLYTGLVKNVVLSTYKIK